MALQKDVRDAVARVRAATEQLDRIVELPTEVGSKVRWTNGVVWVRVGEDDWQPDNELEDSAWGPAPSSHVAQSARWTVVR